MKPEIHPNYRDVVFHDTSADEYFIIGSTLNTSETMREMVKLTLTLLLILHLLHTPFIQGSSRLQVLKVELRNLIVVLDSFQKRKNSLVRGGELIPPHQFYLALIHLTAVFIYVV